jgi:hypothetical protein
MFASTCFGQVISYPAEVRNKPFISVTDAPYLAKTGGPDSRQSINAALTAAAAQRACVYFPSGQYAIAGTLSWTGGLCVVADAGAILLYSGTGTAVSLTTPSGVFNGLAIRSTTGSANIGLDIVGATEFSSDHLYVGGSPRSRFTTGIRLRSSVIDINHLTSSWNSTGVLLDLDSSANSQVRLENGQYFQAVNAAIQLGDVGDAVIQKNYFEAVQSAILLDNLKGPVVATGTINISNNHALLLAASTGVTFANPQFLHINGRNAENALNVKQFHVDQNNVSGSSGSYCNTFLKLRTVPGNTYNLFFSGNTWVGCTVAAMFGDVNSIAVLSANESRPLGVPEFSGGMYGVDSRLDVTGVVASTYNGSYLPLPYVAPTSGIASPDRSYSPGLQSQIIECNSTANGNATVLLPTRPGTGQVITVKKIDSTAHNCVIEPQGNAIDGARESIDLNQRYGYGTFWYDGTGWWVLSRN